MVGLLVQMWGDNVWNTNPVGTTVFEKQPHFATIKALLINNAQQYDFSGTADDLTRALKAQRERHRHLLLCSMISELGIASYRKLEVETEEYIRGVIAKVLSWEYGVFVFQPHSIPHEVSVLNKGLNVEELLLSGMFTTETVSGFGEQPIEDEAEW